MATSSLGSSPSCSLEVGFMCPLFFDAVLFFKHLLKGLFLFLFLITSFNVKCTLMDKAFSVGRFVFPLQTT